MQSSLLVLMWILSWCGLGACHACHDKAKVTENGLHLCLLLCFRYWRFYRFIRAEDLYLPSRCKISIACLPFTKVAFAVLFPTKLVLPLSDFNCKRYGISGFQKGRFSRRVLLERSNSLLMFPPQMMDNDVSLHDLVELYVAIPTGPRSSKTDSG